LPHAAAAKDGSMANAKALKGKVNGAEGLVAPLHLALIPDGNRRWAKGKGFGLFLGYKNGISKFYEFSKWSKAVGVRTLTVWALSTENLTNRSATELKVLFGLYIRAARDRKLLEDLKRNGTRIKIVGNIGGLPRKLREALYEVERKTQDYGDMTINLLVNYGGKDDLVYSARQLVKEARKGAAVDEKLVEKHLRTAALPDVDLVVRTSGEMRLSGLLPWQAAYSELYFSDKYWPEFGKRDFDKAMRVFSSRQRRFGK